MPSLTGLGTLVVAAILSRIVYCCYFHPLSRYPGPFLAKFTNFWKFIEFFRGTHHETEKRLHDLHGDIIRVGPDSLSFSSLEAYRAIYGYDHSFVKGSFYDFARDSDGNSSIFAIDGGEAYRAHRKKIVTPALKYPMVSAYRQTVLKHCDALAAAIEAEITQNKSKTVNVAPLIHTACLNAILETVFGPKIFARGQDEKRTGFPGIAAAFREMSKFSWGCSILPALGWLMATRPMVALVRKPRRDGAGNLLGFSALAARMNHLIYDEPALVQECAQPSIAMSFLNDPRFEREEVRRECYNLMFAGPGSTSGALTAALHHLAATEKGRRWQARILEDVGRRESPTASPVLAAVLKETLRLDCPFPSAFPRTVAANAKESHIPGTSGILPVGTTVSANTWILGRSKKIWGETAEEWDPERWLASEESQIDLESKFVAFSKGARSCAGKDVALVVLTEAVMSILRKWELTDAGRLEGDNFLEMQYQVCEIGFRERATG